MAKTLPFDRAFLEQVAQKFPTPFYLYDEKAIRANADVQRGLVLLSVLDIQRHEAALHASGKLVGSIDSPAERNSPGDKVPLFWRNFS